MDVQSLLESFGYFLIFLSVFIECGVLIGLVLPLPGFSLLLTAGIFASTGRLDIALIIIVGTSAAILGYIAGYFTGTKYGRKLFYERDTQKYFTAAQGKATEKFMKKYGYSTLVLSRYLPIMHNVAPLLSGVAKTPLLPFMIANVVGGFIWVTSATLLGYYFGQSVPNAQYYIIPFFFITIVLVNSRFGKNLLARITKKVESL